MKKIVIAVDKGAFRSVYQGAEALDTIDWNDSSSPEAETSRECFGALDLLCHIQKLAPRTEFAVESEMPSGEAVIVIGRLAQKVMPVDLSSMGEEDFLIRTEKRDGRIVTGLYGRTGTAVLYAVSGYLESLGVRWFSPSVHGTHIPVREEFCLPDIQTRQSPSFKTRGCYSEIADDSDEAFLNWLMHNRVNFAYLEQYKNIPKLKKRGIKVCRGGHSILYQYFSPKLSYPYSHLYRPDQEKPVDPYPLSLEAVPAGEGEEFTYFHAHPEWYGMVVGKRSQELGTGRTEGFGDNFCTSNPDAVRELCGRLVESLISGELSDADYLNFWMLDNGRWCQCPECKKNGNETARLCFIVYQLNKRIQEARKKGLLRREITILFPAYHETLPLPDQPLPEDFDYRRCVVTYFPIERCYVHHIDDPNCTETNSRLFEQLREWTGESGGNYRGELFIGEYYNVGSFASVSVSFAEKMAHDIPLYHQMGARHMYYMHMTARDWGTLAFTNGLFYSMLWNVGLNAEHYKKEFYSLYYREVSGVMEQFYGLLEKGSANMKYFKHYQYLFEGGRQERLALWGRLNQMAGKREEVFPLKHMQYDVTLKDPNGGISAVEMMEVYHQCRTLLEKARYCSEDETTALRLEEDTARFEYTWLSLNYLFHMARLAIFHEENKKTAAGCEYQIAAGYAGWLKKITRPLEGLLHFEFYDNGLSATWAEEAFRRYSAIYGDEDR